MKPTIAELKKTFYHPPLPTKKQRVVHCKEGNGKVRVYTEEEKFLHLMKMNKDRLIFE